MNGSQTAPTATRNTCGVTAANIALIKKLDADVQSNGDNMNLDNDPVNLIELVSRLISYKDEAQQVELTFHDTAGTFKGVIYKGPDNQQMILTCQRVQGKYVQAFGFLRKFQGISRLQVVDVKQIRAADIVVAHRLAVCWGSYFRQGRLTPAMPNGISPQMPITAGLEDQLDYEIIKAITHINPRSEISKAATMSQIFQVVNGSSQTRHDAETIRLAINRLQNNGILYEGNEPDTYFASQAKTLKMYKDIVVGLVPGPRIQKRSLLSPDSRRNQEMIRQIEKDLTRFRSVSAMQSEGFSKLRSRRTTGRKLTKRRRTQVSKSVITIQKDTPTGDYLDLRATKSYRLRRDVNSSATLNQEVKVITQREKLVSFKKWEPRVAYSEDTLAKLGQRPKSSVNTSLDSGLGRMMIARKGIDRKVRAWYKQEKYSKDFTLQKIACQAVRQDRAKLLRGNS